jgi:hypothetical protein
VFAAVWGLAAGSRSAGLALANVYKVPMVVLLSCAFAAPAGLLAWRLSGTRVRGSDLALGFSGGVFGGTLVLAVFAPLIALYYHSSAWAGPVLGLGSVGLALLTGTIMFVRGEGAGEEHHHRHLVDVREREAGGAASGREPPHRSEHERGEQREDDELHPARTARVLRRDRASTGNVDQCHEGSHLLFEPPKMVMQLALGSGCATP